MLNETDTTFCLHGLAAVYLTEFGWYRIDPRGNIDAINAQFHPPHECLAFHTVNYGERDFALSVSYRFAYPATIPTFSASLRLSAGLDGNNIVLQLNRPLNPTERKKMVTNAMYCQQTSRSTIATFVLSYS